MPAGRRSRDLLALAALSLLLAGLAVTPAARWLAGLSYDTALLLRHHLFDPGRAPAQSHAVVVALDEETYRRPPFQATPQAAWTPQLATLLTSITAADAAVVGFDLVYPTSLESMQRGYDRSFLLALRQAARENRLILGKVQHGAHPIEPHPMQKLAVGGAANIRSLNVLEDADGIIRRLPLFFATAEPHGHEPGFALDMAQRLAGSNGLPQPARPDTPPLLLNFNTRPGAIPTYSAADLLACAEAGDAAYFQRHFAGKAVIFASVLDVEDRRLTTKRLTTQPDGSHPPPRCRLETLPLGRADLARDSIPGVYIHATAINNLIDGDALQEISPPGLFGIALVLTGLVVLAAYFLPLAQAALSSLALVLMLPVAAAWSLHQGIALPWLTLEAIMALALGGSIAYRIMVTDQDKRLIARLFSLYLPGSVIDGMLRAGRLPALGGEEREVSILFSDIAGFTRLAETMPPTDLVQALNDYFTAMTTIIEQHGGFVDKFIGDAIVAVFGAPLAQHDHATQAVRAALAMQQAVNAEPRHFTLAGQAFSIRIGINTGPVLIGNIGSPRRLNYTIIGDAVNLAARLEGANKQYHSNILVSETTAAAAGPAFAWRLIDRVRVLGREQPVAILTPLAGEQAGLAPTYQAIWAHIEQRDFAAAAALLQPLSDDPVAVNLLARLPAMAAAPSQPWPPVTDLTEK